MTSTSAGPLSLYQAYVDGFEQEVSKGTGRTWTPFRFCSEDWLLAIAVVRGTRQSYDVALLACEDHMDFEPNAGLKAALSFMLADSYHKTGKMQIRFCGPQRGEEPSMKRGYCIGVPDPIRKLCKSYGVNLGKGRILSHKEGSALYQRMVGLSKKLADALQRAGVDALRSAFLLHRGVTGVESLEVIARYSARALDLLEGRLVPDNWLAFKKDFLLLRRGMLAERARILFEQGAFNPRERAKSSWVTPGTLQLVSDSEVTLTSLTEEKIVLAAGEKTKFILCSNDEIEFEHTGIWDSLANSSKGSEIVIVPRNFSWLKKQSQQKLLSRAEDLGLRVVQIHESLDELDGEALLRLERFATTRAAIEAQKE